MEKFDINPFDRAALTDYRLLAGRSNEFRKIRFILRNSTKQSNRLKSLLITGSRGVGKTSFLNLIEKECIENNIIPVRINLTETNSINSNEFFWYLFSQTINTLFSLDLLYGKGGIIDATVQDILHGDGLKDQANWIFRTPILRRNYLENSNLNFEFDLFASDVTLIRKEIATSGDKRFNEKTKILYLVDESQIIYPNAKITQDIRYIVQNQDIGIGFAFAGDKTFESSPWEQVFGGSYRDFEIINLSYFEETADVIDYFKKSLSSVGWTTKEIEETLFYRFKLSCRQIFQLTSGKPAWINTVASKMFERCMKGEIDMLRFDREAQADVKYLLESSGELDKSKLEAIDNLTPKYKKWLIEIFASELCSLKQVYFYSKFRFIGDDFLTLTEYENFCKSLIQQGIIKILEEDEKTIDDIKFEDISTKPFLAFGYNADTIKQWLQINSDGKFRFSIELPSNRFIKYINDQLVSEMVNTSLIRNAITSESLFRLKDMISSLNKNTLDINDITFESASSFYAACKKLDSSRFKQSLFVKFTNQKLARIFGWNVYNYDDKDKVIDFIESKSRIEKIISTVESYNDEENDLKLEISIDTLESPDLKKLQKLILKSGDKKKLGIILDDKDEDLVNAYIKLSDLQSSQEIANFFYELFEEGYDLSIRNLNNAAYVFIAANELEKALKMLTEALKMESSITIFDDDKESAADLAIYNLAILNVKNGEYQKAIVLFEKVIEFYESNDKFQGNVGVLFALEFDEDTEIKIIEIRENDTPHSTIKCKDYSKQNIEILKKILV
ncbi:MAG TPA: tetratricopeptide repeat protein [Mucilaginibacter sp.]|nr:tetratricopeptide repeat protein [Mucilaginibacter sp.]